ncbi:hypothetical protein AB1N83_004608 [Pleurotus pulmonarius]
MSTQFLQSLIPEYPSRSHHRRTQQDHARLVSVYNICWIPPSSPEPGSATTLSISHRQSRDLSRHENMTSPAPFSKGRAEKRPLSL